MNTFKRILVALVLATGALAVAGPASAIGSPPPISYKIVKEHRVTEIGVPQRRRCTIITNLTTGTEYKRCGHWHAYIGATIR